MKLLKSAHCSTSMRRISRVTVGVTISVLLILEAFQKSQGLRHFGPKEGLILSTCKPFQFQHPYQIHCQNGQCQSIVLNHLQSHKTFKQGTHLDALIPSSINFDDKYESVAAVANVATATTTAVALEGGFNLGVLFWAFVLYNGLFPVAGKPADWILPLLEPFGFRSTCGSTTQQSNQNANTLEQPNAWLEDYKAGYYFVLPVEAEFIRSFAILGFSYLVNLSLVNLFEGDAYWCWSSGACLSIPAGLIALSRDKRQTRADVELETLLAEDLNTLFAKRLSNAVGKRVLDEDIVQIVRRNYNMYRMEDTISTKTIKKIVKRVLGRKPTREGYYNGIEVLDDEERARALLRESLAKAKQLKLETMVNTSSSKEQI